MAPIARHFQNYKYWCDRLDSTLKSLSYSLSVDKEFRFYEICGPPAFCFRLGLRNGLEEIYMIVHNLNDDGKMWCLRISSTSVTGELEYVEGAVNNLSGKSGLESYVDFDNDVESGLTWLLSRLKDQIPLQLPMVPAKKKPMSWTNWCWSWLGFEKLD